MVTVGVLGSFADGGQDDLKRFLRAWRTEQPGIETDIELDDLRAVTVLPIPLPRPDINGQRSDHKDAGLVRIFRRAELNAEGLPGPKRDRVGGLPYIDGAGAGGPAAACGGILALHPPDFEVPPGSAPHALSRHR